MSRGPRTFHRRVLETLAAFWVARRTLEWHWRGGGLDRAGGTRWTLARLAWEEDIANYERGLMIPMWLLLDHLKYERSALSRALRGLYRRRLVLLYGSDLRHLDDPFNDCKAAKYAGISKAGRAWLTANNCTVPKLALKPGSDPGRHSWPTWGVSKGARWRGAPFYDD